MVAVPVDVRGRVAPTVDYETLFVFFASSYHLTSTLGRGQRPVNGRSAVHLSFGPYAPGVAIHDPAHSREPDPRSREVGHRVKSLKWREESFRVRLIESGAVVLHVEGGLTIILERTKLHAGTGRLGRELPGIAEEVLQEDLDKTRIALGDKTVFDDESHASMRVSLRKYVTNM